MVIDIDYDEVLHKQFKINCIENECYGEVRFPHVYGGSIECDSCNKNYDDINIQLKVDLQNINNN